MHSQVIERPFNSYVILSLVLKILALRFLSYTIIYMKLICMVACIGDTIYTPWKLDYLQIVPITRRENNLES